MFVKNESQPTLVTTLLFLSFAEWFCILCFKKQFSYVFGAKTLSSVPFLRGMSVALFLFFVRLETEISFFSILFIMKGKRLYFFTRVNILMKLNLRFDTPISIYLCN